MHYDERKYYCLSNTLHSSIGQNIKSHTCPLSVIRCPFSGQNVKNFKWPQLTNASSDRLRVWFYGGVFGDGGSNGAISGWIKSKMAASGHFEELGFF